MNEGKRLLKNTGLIAIGNTSTKIVSFFLLPLYTALLSKEEYGVIDYIMSIVSFLVPFVNLLMDESIFRFLLDCKNDIDKKRVISSTVFTVFMGLSLLLLISIPVGIFKDIRYFWFVIAYVTVTALSGILSSLLRGIGRTDQFTFYNFCNSVANITLNVVFIAYFFMGVDGMLFAALISSLINSVSFFFSLKLYQYINYKYFDKNLIKEMLAYSIPLIPNKISWNIINLSNRIIIMDTIGSAAAGLFAIANKFPGLMDTVYGFFYQAWKESSARVIGEDKQEDFYNSIYRALKDFLFSFVLLLIASMPLAFHLLINKAYHEALLYVPPLLLGTYFSNISGFYGGIFTAYKDTKIMGTTTVVSAIVNIILNLITIKYFGLWAASISMMISTYIVYEYRRMKLVRYVSLQENLSDQLLSIAIAVVVLCLFYSNNLMCYALGMFVSILYSIVSNREILNRIFIIIKRKVQKGR